MGRIQFYELEDQRWIPRSLRDTITDGIRLGINFADIYSVITERLSQAVENAEADNILDIGSGGGGPWPKLWARLCEKRSNLCLHLSDKRPNLPALRRIEKLLGSQVNVIEQPLGADGRGLPRGFRTLFSVFHHFAPSQAREILNETIRDAQGIAVFEITGRSPRSFLLALAVPLLMILTGLFIRPFRLSRIFWTYLVPLAPVIAFFDGIISCLRTYTPSESLALLDGLSAKNYVWHVGIEKSGVLKIPITYFIGYPERKYARVTESTFRPLIARKTAETPVLVK